MLDERAQVIVAGGGLAAYAAALAAAGQGAEVLLIPGGGKAWALFGGSLYTRGQMEDAAFQALVELYTAAGYPVGVARAGETFLLPTTLGTLRAADLTPEEFQAADLGCPDPLLLVGWQELPSFSAAWAAAALQRQLQERAGRIDGRSPAVSPPLVLAATLAISEVFPRLVSGRERGGGDFPGLNWRALAAEMERPEGVRALVSGLELALVRTDLPAAAKQAHSEGRLRVALPVVGLDRTRFIREEVYRLSGLVLCEVAGLLPAPGGLRARAILDRALAGLRVAVRPGWTVTRIAVGNRPAVSGYVQGTETEFTVSGEYLILAADFASDSLTYLAADTPAAAGCGGRAENRLVLAGATGRVAGAVPDPIPGSTHAILWRSGYLAGREVAARWRGRKSSPALDGGRVEEGA
ncbi:MAG: hypothetical protein IMX00_07430 [Limnochordales bacterium]|nr:hypothetical protein [Limnochordales bacterium]